MRARRGRGSACPERSGTYPATPLQVLIRQEIDRQRPHPVPDGCSIYVMFTQPIGDRVFAKVGISVRVDDRLLGVQTGCPIPIECAIHYRLPTRALAVRVERLMHAKLEHLRSSGEWFALVVSDASHKAEFHRACREAMAEVTSGDWTWAVVTPK